MTLIGTSSAAIGATILSITHGTPRPGAVAIAGGCNYRLSSGTTTATTKLIIQPCRSTGARRRRNHCFYKKTPVIRASEADIMAATEISGIKIINNPPESKLTELGVRSWPKWGCPPSKFPWTYSSKETCYLLKGKVKVYPDGSDQAAEFGAGDLVEFPKGMSCTWEVSETVDKHYKFE